MRANRIPLKSIHRNINKKGQPNTTIVKMARGGDVMPKRNKKNFRPTKSGAGMTRAGVASYRRKKYLRVKKEKV